MRPLTSPHSPALSLGLLATAVLPLATQLACKGCGSDQVITPDDTLDSGDAGPGDGGAEQEYTNDWGQWLTMAVMQDGRPALAFYDRTKGGLGFAIANIDGETVEWEREQPDGYTNEDGLDVGDRGTYASMAVAQDGTVWVAYRDNALENLRYAWRDPATGAWTNNTADGGQAPSGTGGMFASLAIDASSNPVIAHYDDGNRALRVARWNGAAFTAETIDEGEPGADAEGAEVAADVGSYADLEIRDGVDYIAYYDATHGNLKLAWGVTGGPYTIEVIDDGGGSRLVEGGGDVGQWPDIVVQDGQLWVSYHDVGNQDLRLAKGVPGNWTIEVVDDGEFVGADSELFLNGSQPSIAYFDGRNNDMMLATRVGDAWTIEVLAGEGALGFHNEVVQASGTSYAASYDYTTRTVWFDRLD